jgi:hypothetical protein
MDKRPISLVAVLLAAGWVAGDARAEAYRWVDSEGIVHYSDRPEPGAEEIVLPEANTTSVRRVTPRTRAAANTESSQPTDFTKYESIEVTSPAAEETLWNIEGVLTVSLALSPALQPGHQVRVYFDGSPRLVQGTSFQLEEVWRGVHNIQAEVLDEAGKLMIRGQPTRFYVQQNTVNF